MRRPQARGSEFPAAVIPQGFEIGKIRGQGKE
jgi:hypothetical protein